MRAWLRLNLFLSIVLTIAGALLIPAVARVLEQMARSSHGFAAIIGDLIGILTALPPAVISIGVLYLGFVLFRRLRRQRRHRGHLQDDYYNQ